MHNFDHWILRQHLEERDSSQLFKCQKKDFVQKDCIEQAHKETTRGACIVEKGTTPNGSEIVALGCQHWNKNQWNEIMQMTIRMFVCLGGYPDIISIFVGDSDAIDKSNQAWFT